MLLPWMLRRTRQILRSRARRTYAWLAGNPYVVGAVYGAPRSALVAGYRLASAVHGAIPAVDLATLKVVASELFRVGAMDPRLQVAIVSHRLGGERPATTVVEKNEISVIARVDDLRAWNELSQVRPGTAVVRPLRDGEAARGIEWLVTARVPVTSLEAVRQAPCVLSMKAAQALRPMLDKTTTEIGPDPVQAQPGGGRGVVVGIVDYGCDVTHPNFRHADGTTRLLCLWDQSGEMRAGNAVTYGRLLTQDEIDDALDSPNPWNKLQYDPPFEHGPSPGSHGTHVMDIAAGNGLGTGVPGCAPEADLIFVDLSSTLATSGAAAVGKSFGDSSQLIDAVEFIFRQAGDRPCVVNVSLGMNGGPHDGTTPVELALDGLVRAANDRAVVVAAHNAYKFRTHAQGNIPANGSFDLEWETPTSPFGHEMEIWLPGTPDVEIELFESAVPPAPLSAPFGKARLGENFDVKFGTQLAGFVASRANDPSNQDSTFMMFVAPNTRSVRWLLRLTNKTGSDVDFHAWAEAADDKHSSFPQASQRCTLGTISTGRDTIVVGSYDANDASLATSIFSSSGPTRDDRKKPDVSAPGDKVMAAWSLKRRDRTEKSGTSMAAPAVTGLVALLLAEARRKGITMNIDAIRKAVIDTARRDPPAVGPNGWDERLGFGRISKQALTRV